MAEGVMCNAEEKLDDVGKTFYVENLANYKKDEFLRKQLYDAAQVHISELSLVLSQIENNFDSYLPSEIELLRTQLAGLKSNYCILLDSVKAECEF